MYLFLPGNGERQQIDYVLQGGVLRNQQHLHITVQLVRLSDQKCVWVKDFDRASDNPRTEMDMADEVVGQMQHTLASLGSEPR